jgi:septum formation protein
MRDSERTFSSVSKVLFAQLSDEQIEYYVANYKPMDKAGSYGIQEWIGYVGIESIEGSFFNVMGLPVQRLCRELECFVEALPSCYL